MIFTAVFHLLASAVRESSCNDQFSENNCGSVMQIRHICNLFQRNSDCSSRDLRNTVTDLRLPMNTSFNQGRLHTPKAGGQVSTEGTS